MKDVILLGVTFAIFAFGFLIMRKLDEFLEESRRAVEAEQRRAAGTEQKDMHLHSGKETGSVLKSIENAGGEKNAGAFCAGSAAVRPAAKK